MYVWTYVCAAAGGVFEREKRARRRHSWLARLLFKQKHPEAAAASCSDHHVRHTIHQFCEGRVFCIFKVLLELVRFPYNSLL